VRDRWRGGLALAVLLCLALLGWSVPRSLAYDDLLRENLALKARLREVDHKLSEVDRILLRLRVYDAQLRSLAEPTGDHGPVPSLPGGGRPALAGMADGEPMEPIHDADWHQVREAAGLRPAEAWANAVKERAEGLLAAFESTELDLNRLAGDLEELRALEAALPRVWPAEGRITSGFGWRHNPLGGRGWDHHSGLDISNRPGVPIRAPSPGRVVRAWYNSGYGRMVEIDHGFGVTTVYAHCARLLVKDGQEVETGDLIATLGSTGRSTGPHLHFEVRIDGHAVDPLNYLGR